MGRARLARTALVLLVTALALTDITAAFETTMVFSAMASIIAEYGRPVAVGWLITA